MYTKYSSFKTYKFANLTLRDREISLNAKSWETKKITSL